VVNWNTVGLLDDCLRGIIDATPDGLTNEIVVVDNASSDGSVAHLRSHWPDVKLIVNERNEGFCRANNVAIKATQSEYVLLVNTDARLRPGGVAALLRYFADDSRAAVVGPRLEYADGAFQRWTAGRAFTLGSAANYLLMLDRIAPRRAAGIYLGYDTDQPFRPGWVSSAVMALRRTAIEEVGLLDNDIFVYMDDVDLCDRLGANGWHVWYAADTTATHFMGGTAARVTATGSPEAMRALNRWFAQRHGLTRARVLQALEVAGFGARSLLYGAAAGLRRSPGARASMRAHLAHLRLALEPVHV
jgi:N-acetylglucosaminyl-diphospho-decaprenol L-rhamnosyltransferase